ncbi:hypothetical protein JCM10213_007326 [Rhodosporidiobolus nylandii]
MPPKKKAAAAAPRRLPPPNDSHPCASLLPSVLADPSLADRPHPGSYHTFLSSPLYPSHTLGTRDSSPPPKKRKKKDDEPKLPPLLEGALDASIVQRKLLSWFDGVRDTRGMPWRKDVDPAALSAEERAQRGYEVWVSEIMLQQTQVVTVIDYWKKWMAKFPTVRDLASADIEEVNAVWQGLGYYSRAKRLLDGAKTVVDKHDGLLPETAEGLLEVDGIGPYTAGAISSIAFAQRSPLVDGNVQRVFSRLTALHAPAAAKSTTNFIWALADVLVPEQAYSAPSSADSEAGSTSSPASLGDVGGKNTPGAWNQALMELGATVCTPKNPKCDECPVSEDCLAYAEARYVAHAPRASSSASASPDIEDLCALCAPLPYEDTAQAKKHDVEVYPMAKERAKKREEESAVCVLEWVQSGKEGDGDEERKVLLVKRPEKGLLAGLFEFPAVDLPPSASISTPKSRDSYLDALLTTLLSDPSLTSALSASSLSPSSSASSASLSGGLTVLSRAALPPVTHTYSHMVRTYHAIRVVLSSPSLPTLHTASSGKGKGKDADGLVHSLPGRGRWVDAAGVKGENIGGAVGKVWDERQRAVKGLPSSSAKAKKAAAGGKAKAKKQEQEGEKGQASLMGFFGKKPAKEKAGGMGKRSAKEEDEGDDEVVIVEERAEQVEVSGWKGKGAAAVTVKVEEKKVYKKRRIAPASDEED